MDGLTRHNGNGIIEPAAIQDRRERARECDEVRELTLMDYDGDVQELALTIRTEILQWADKLPSVECLCQIIDKWKEDWL